MLLLLAINIFLLLVGMVMDLTPNILIFAPVFYLRHGPVSTRFFGLLFILNLGIGVITRGYGALCGLRCEANIKITKLVRHAAVPGDGIVCSLLFFPRSPLRRSTGLWAASSIHIFVMGPLQGPFCP